MAKSTNLECAFCGDGDTYDYVEALGGDVCYVCYEGAEMFDLM